MNLHEDFSLIKSFFENLTFKKDFRNKVDLRTFLTALIFGLTEVKVGDRFSLSFLSSKLGNVGELFSYSRSGFWRKLGSHSLTQFLEYAIRKWIACFNQSIGLSEEFLRQLGVIKLFALDSTTITLPEEAKESFPGVARKGGDAAVKLHALLEIMTGSLSWFKISSGTSHDSQHIPGLKNLEGSLLLIDLGYFSYKFFAILITGGVKFVSRLKSNSVLRVKKTVRGLGQKTIGKNHTDISRKREGNVVEYIGSIDGGHEVRVIGHWNKKEKEYHWYITNLECDAECVYSIYRVRWQIEILFKAFKGFISFAEMPSANPVIIKNLILGRLLAAMLILKVGKISMPNPRAKKEDKQKEITTEVSLQRIFMFFCLIRTQLHEYIVAPKVTEHNNILNLCNALERGAKILLNEPFLKRKTSIGRVKLFMEAA